MTPFAVKANLTVKNTFNEKDVKAVAKHLLKQKGTILLVWEHSVIPDLAKLLSVANPLLWDGKDFDSIWVITFKDGTASLADDHKLLEPPTRWLKDGIVGGEGGYLSLAKATELAQRGIFALHDAQEYAAFAGRSVSAHLPVASPPKALNGKNRKSTTLVSTRRRPFGTRLDRRVQTPARPQSG